MILVAALVAAAPMLVTAIAFVVGRPAIFFDGDQALDELALMKAEHFDQLVGNYSRFGWNHPGPAWFYALSAIYQPLGSESWAFVVASLVLQGLAAAIIVAICARVGGRGLAVLAAGVLLLYFGLVGDQLFRNVWPPFAVILPMAIFLLLAAKGASGSIAALAGAMVAGSYEVQVHVGTALMVAAVGGVAGIIWLLRRMGTRQAPPQPRPASGRTTALLTAAALIVVVVMWIPPLVDELTGHPGNLSVLWQFFTTHGAQRGWRPALSTLGRLLDPFEMRNLAGYGAQGLAAEDYGFMAAAGAFAGLSLALAAAATWAKDRFAQSTGILLLVGLAAAAYSVRDIVGPVYSYLLFWVTTMPLVLVIGFAELAISRRDVIRWSAKPGWRPALVAAAWLIVLGLAAVRTVEFLGLPADPLSVQHTDYLASATESALPRDRSQPVLLEPSGLGTWDVAAGVGLQLAKHGYTIRVETQWTFMFGRDALRQGDERWGVVFQTAADAPGYAATHPEARPIASTDAYTLYLVQLS